MSNRDLKSLLLSLGYSIRETEQGLLITEHEEPGSQSYKDLSRLERMAAKAMAKKVLQG